MVSRALGRLLTGPLAFLAAGLIDVFAYNVQWLLRVTRRRLAASTMARR